MKLRVWTAALLLAGCLTACAVPGAGQESRETVRATDAPVERPDLTEVRLSALEAEMAALRALMEGILGVETDAPPTETDGETDTEAASLPEGERETPTEAPPPPTVTEADFLYRLEDGGAVVTGYIGAAAHVVIPTVLGGAPVTAIGDEAFAGCEALVLTLPDGVEVIGWFAFAGCHCLAAVELPATVERIEYGAFDGCPRVVLRAPQGSYAAAYAASFGLAYIEG